ncbi:hypothetical protein K431DRAFT_305391 [Polychaeton citri CBS 116435]|uniref:Uncharacterized protein n=1 Tax=Polychaeton citri CBS 116435 TaxID=1314669 RepID=A0A9P4UKN3_9PEZI|nr:hypothetical protein K431DRAFT_305391 [Polychaeton citri CBS 116435]
MLNAKALTQVLAQNADGRICKTWFLMTGSGALLASSQTTTDRQLRKQVSVVALSWKDHAHTAEPAQSGFEHYTANGASSESPTTITIESQTANIIAKMIQPNLFLVLEGGTPPRRPGFEAKVTAEGQTHERYPSIGEGDISLPGSPHSLAASSVNSTVALSVLRYQREKLEAMAETIATDLESIGFSMPGENKENVF